MTKLKKTLRKTSVLANLTLNILTNCVLIKNKVVLYFILYISRIQRIENGPISECLAQWLRTLPHEKKLSKIFLSNDYWSKQKRLLPIVLK